MGNSALGIEASQDHDGKEKREEGTEKREQREEEREKRAETREKTMGPGMGPQRVEVVGSGFDGLMQSSK